MKSRRTAKARVPASGITFDALVGLMGKRVDDPAVEEVFAKAGKVSIGKSHAVSKTAGFEFLLLMSPDEQRGSARILGTLFLQAGRGGVGAFQHLPTPFLFGARAALLAAVPPPSHGFTTARGKMKGKIPLDQEVYRDAWTLGTRTIYADYKKGVVKTFVVMSADKK